MKSFVLAGIVSCGRHISLDRRSMERVAGRRADQPGQVGPERIELDRSELETILTGAKSSPLSEAEYAKLHAAMEPGWAICS
jgi:hypothetical protein